MALEFALRPRISLERPAPRRQRARIPRFALLMALYWVGIAGATVVLLRVMKEEPDASAAEVSADDTPAREPEPPALAEPAPPPEPPISVPPLPRDVPAAPRVALTTPREPSPTPRPAPTTERPAPTTAPDAPAVAAPKQPAPADVPATALPSCEAAAASANETLDLRDAPGTPDLPREAFAAVLDDGAYLAPCAPPVRTSLELCAAVQDGRVVGVSASSEPRNPALNACVRRAVAALRFPKSPRLDIARTRFDAAR